MPLLLLELLELLVEVLLEVDVPVDVEVELVFAELCMPTFAPEEVVTTLPSATILLAVTASIISKSLTVAPLMKISSTSD